MSAVDLYNYETGEVEKVDESVADSLVTGRTHSPVGDGPINVVDRETGRAAAVTGDDLLRALREGYRLETSKERRLAEEKIEYGEGFAPVKASLLGAARGATFGLSDQALVHLADVDPDKIKKLRDYNPGLSTGFEVGGAVGSMLIPGGAVGAAAKAGRLAGTLPRAAVGAGSLAGKGTAKLLAAKASSGLARKALAKVAPKAVESAVEGALFATGQVISEDALGETELVSQKALNTIGMGALLGGIVGGGVSAGTGLGSLAVKKGVGKIDDFVAGGGLGKKVQGLRKNAFMGNQGRSGDDVYAKWNKKGAVDKLDDEFKILDDVSHPRDIARKVDDIHEQLKAKGNEIVENLPQGPGVGVKRDKLLDALGRAKKEIEPVAGEGGIGEIAKRIRQIEKTTDDVIPFDRAIRIRDQLGSVIKQFDETNLSKRTKLDIKNTVSDLIDEAADPHIEGGAAAWKELRHKIKMTSKSGKTGKDRTIGDLVHEHANKVERQSSTPLSSQIGAGTTTLGAVGLGAGPLPALIAGGIAHAGIKAAKVHGNALASRMLSRASGLAAIEKGMVETTKKLTKAVETFGKKASPAAAAGAGVAAPSPKTKPKSNVIKFPSKKERRERFKKKRDEVAYLSNNPEVFVERMERNLAPISQSAPKVAAAMATTSARGLAYLKEAIPKDPIENRVFGEFEPSDADVAKFERIAAIIDKPASIVDRLNDGTLTRDEVKAMRAVYPDMYADIVGQLTDQVAMYGDSMPYQSRVSLGILFDTALDPSMRPQFVAAYQANFGQQATQAQQQGAQKPDLSAIRSDRYAPRSAQLAQGLS